MDITEKNIGHVSEISNNGSEILDQNDKASSLTISSQRPDSQNLSSNKQDSSDHTSNDNLPSVSTSDQLDSNDNLHASGNSDGADLSSIKPNVSTSDQSDSNDNLHANGNPDGVDLFSIKSTISVSDKSDNECAGILIVNDKVNNPDELCDTPESLVFPSGKFGSYTNSNSKPQESEAPKANTGSGVISNDKPENGTFSTGNPVNCDFSSDEPWNENFPKRKSRSSGFFSENIWGSNYSSDNPVSCDFSSDDFSGVEVENAEDSSNQHLSDDSSSQEISDTGFLNGKPETFGFSSNKPWSADFSSDKTVIPVSLDFSNETPVFSKHSNSSLDANSDTSSAMTETSNKLGANSNLLNGNSCSTTKESMTTNMPYEELDKAEALNNCFENPIRSSKDFYTESFAIETSEIPSYLIETSGVLGNDPSKCKTEKEINDIYISSCKYPDYESREKVDHEIEVNADRNWKIEKCHQSTVFVLKRADENAQYKFQCIYFNKGTKLDELFKNRSHDELNVSQGEILECIDSMKEDQLNFIEPPVESNDQSGFLEDRMGTSENEVAIGDGKIEKCSQSTVFVLKRRDENAQYKFKCIYFNKRSKLDDIFKNGSNVDLNDSQDEILEYIDSMKDQLNFIEDPAESNDQSGFLENRMGPLEMIDEDLVDNELVHKKAKEQIIFYVDKMLNDEFGTMAKSKENLDLTHWDSKLRENEMVENAGWDDVKNVLIYDQIFSNKLGVNLENELIGSKVQDISGYLSSTETNINDSVNETTNTRIELNTFSIPQKMLNCVKIVGETIFSVMLGVLGYVFHRTKSLASTECATNQTIPVTDVEEFQSETNATFGPSTSLTNSNTVTSESLKMKTRITNFSTLFQHLSATVGTDLTAERVMKDINSQVVMDIYNGFHELRIVDYGSLDLMSKCIKGCIVTLQRTLTHSDPIVLKASELLRKKTHTLEEMRKMNEDLKELTSDAEAHLHSIDRALTGLEDYTDDFMYYKNAISKELVEFLQEDFPEIFK
ncbi:hypothetical protein JTE90_002145 [Oedothorax gibbosus]|uniref:Uncharacterized protein n=1 Tax=Oedothorax gibbosus TaxID=931172 RepID=A0AAV6V6I4_9ARAC|nr:hypothetical protein JTE90_002145 [Oedothorax gibbosus]